MTSSRGFKGTGRLKERPMPEREMSWIPASTVFFNLGKKTDNLPLAHERWWRRICLLSKKAPKDAIANAKLKRHQTRVIITTSRYSGYLSQLTIAEGIAINISRHMKEKGSASPLTKSLSRVLPLGVTLNDGFLGFARTEKTTGKRNNDWILSKSSERNGHLYFPY